MQRSDLTVYEHFSPHTRGCSLPLPHRNRRGRLFPAYAGAILIPAERRRSCGVVMHPSIGRPGGPELIYNQYYAYILANANKS